MPYREFPIGVANNPLVKNLFSVDPNSALPRPPISQLRITEDGQQRITEDNINRITE